MSKFGLANGSSYQGHYSRHESLSQTNTVPFGLYLGPSLKDSKFGSTD